MSSTSSHWMLNSYGFYRKAEDVEVRFYAMVNAHNYSEQSDINTEQLIFVSLKKRKKKRKKRNEKKSAHTWSRSRDT